MVSAANTLQRETKLTKLGSRTASETLDITLGTIVGTTFGKTR
jgi:hypothetical protein